MGYLSVTALTLSFAFLVSKILPMIPAFLRSAAAAKDPRTVVELSTSNEHPENVDPITQEESSCVGENGGSTPKASANRPSSEIPTFSLEDEEHVPTASPSPRDEPVPTSSGSGSPTGGQTIPSSLHPTQDTATIRTSATGLMPPPARPAIIPSRNPNASLRVPSTGPLPNRGPPSNSQQRVSALSQANGATQSSSARGKVLLSPGHSPMDWAALTRSSNLSGVDTFRRVTPSELRKMTGRKGKPAWSSWQGKVYNITPYLPFHPGGEAELMKAASRDGTKLFMDVHPWVNWENMLESCLVGVMVPENHGEGSGSSLEDMD